MSLPTYGSSSAALFVWVLLNKVYGLAPRYRGYFDVGQTLIYEATEYGT
jgi:hypothetical protein